MPAFADTLHANGGMSEPRGRLARWSVGLRAVLAASLGAHRKAQHARVCFAGGRYFSRQRQLRECRCSARSAKRLAESSLGNCMLGVWLCPSRSRAPGGTRGGTGCKGAHHRSRYSPFRHWLKSLGLPGPVLHYLVLVATLRCRQLDHPPCCSPAALHCRSRGLSAGGSSRLRCRLEPQGGCAV